MFVATTPSLASYHAPHTLKETVDAKKTVPSHLCGFTPFSVFSFQFSIFRSPQSRTQRTEKPEYWGRCQTSIVAEALNRDLNHEKL